LPDGTRAVAQREATIDSAMVKTLARAFRWQRLLNEGVYTTMEEIAEAEKIGASYISRVVKLVNLAPEIVELIVAGRQPASLTLQRLLEPWPLAWTEQRMHFAVSSSILPSNLAGYSPPDHPH
jgi:hypothetical protein